MLFVERGFWELERGDFQFGMSGRVEEVGVLWGLYVCWLEGCLGLARIVGGSVVDVYFALLSERVELTYTHEREFWPFRKSKFLAVSDEADFFAAGHVQCLHCPCSKRAKGTDQILQFVFCYWHSFLKASELVAFPLRR